MTEADRNRPGAGQEQRGEARTMQQAGAGTGREAPGKAMATGRAKDDVSSAPESGEKPEAAPDGGGRDTSGPGVGTAGRDRDGAQAKDDVSSAPESGDKPDATGRD